ncbi:MAG TPA: phosphatidate cytidylyltransferase [Chitinophagales bacterium]|nr:phosphatidate cytidylyltransferase [Chitinophagales bacterium]
MKDLPKRALTAIIFAAIMLGGLMWNRISFSILLLIIQTGCLYEYLMLVRKFQSYSEKNGRIALIMTMIASSSILLAVLFCQEFPSAIAYGILALPIGMLLMAFELFYRSKTPIINGMLNVGSLVYVSLPILCFYSLPEFSWIDRDQALDSDSNIFLYYGVESLEIILLIWANDTFAYFVGSLIGKHKILPDISPKKSWEGFFGGLIFALITAWILSLYFTKLNLQHWLMVAAIVVVFGTIGDFFESMIKRQAGVKDSGNLLPGHGGFLDRFDALLFCVPFVTVYLLLAP